MSSGEENDENSLNDSFVDEPSCDEEDGNSIANILKRLPSGAIIKKTVLEESFHCKKCKINFNDRQELYKHIIRHVTLPFLILDKIDDDVLDDNDGSDEWSEDDFDVNIDTKPIKIIAKNVPSTLNSILSSNITIKKTTVSSVIEKPGGFPNLLIKKVSLNKNNDTDLKSDDDSTSHISDSAGQSPSNNPIKITIKHKDNNFKVVNDNNDSEKQQTASIPKEIMDTIDSKEGILEKAIKIKTEPGNHESKCDNSSQNNTFGQNIKREIPSPTSELQKKEEEEKRRKLAEQAAIPKPMIIPKKEVVEPTPMIIEINGDDSDNDDDLIFVSSSPLPDRKPIITELPSNTPVTSQNHASTTTTSSSNRPPALYNSSSVTSIPSNKNNDWSSSLENFDAMFSDKSADDILKSLLDDHHRKDSANADYGTSEYISLDKLGPQHICKVCNTKFTSFTLLENHRQTTGHSNELVLSTPKSTAVLPSYKSSNMGLMNSFFPVKEIAETVGKLTGPAANSAFTHQQNIMVNIQSFPGAMNQPSYMGGQHVPAGPSYPGMPPSYPPGYRMPTATPPYPNSSPYMNNGQPYSQNPYGYPPSHQHDNQPNPPFPHGYPSQNSHQPPHPYQGPPNPYLNPQVPPYNQNNMSYPPGTVNSSMPNLPQPMTTMNSQQNQSISQSHMSGGNIRLPSTQPNQLNAPSGHIPVTTGAVKVATGLQQTRPQIRPTGRGGMRGRGGGVRPGMRPAMSPGGQVKKMGGSIIRTPVKRPNEANGGSPAKKRLDMLLPNRHDSEECEAVSIQHQREGLPLIHNIQGSKEAPVQLNSQITVTKKKVRPPTPPPAAKDASSVASMLARRGIKITQKARSPSPPIPNIPNLGSSIVITHTKASSSVSDDKDIFSQRTLKCDTCPMSYPSATQLQEHKRLFHSTSAGDFGLPVVDLSQQGNLRKLNSLGICNFIPLANRETGGGCFGIPIVSVQNMASGAIVNSLQALGSNGLLSLGPVKPLPKC